MSSDDATGAPHGFVPVSDKTAGWSKVAEDIRKRRNEIGLRQEDLAAMARVSRATIKVAENPDQASRITVKTDRMIHYALGWQPREPKELAEGTDPRVVLSAESVGDVAAALLPLLTQTDELGATIKDSPAPMLIAAYHQLIAGLSQSPPTIMSGAGLGALLLAMKRQLPPARMAAFEAELAQRVPAGGVDLVVHAVGQAQENEQAMPITPRTRRRRGGTLPNAAAGIVAQSGLPDPIQAAVFELLNKQYAAMETQLETIATGLIGAANELIARFNKGEPADIDNPDTQVAIADLLKVFFETLIDYEGPTAT